MGWSQSFITESSMEVTLRLWSL